MFGKRRKKPNVVNNPGNFIGFTVPQQKIRIRLPKFIGMNCSNRDCNPGSVGAAATRTKVDPPMPRRDEKCSKCVVDDGNCGKRNKSAKAKPLLSKKIKSMFSKSMRRKKPQETSPSKHNKNGGAPESCTEVPLTTLAFPELRKVEENSPKQQSYPVRSSKPTTKVFPGSRKAEKNSSKQQSHRAGTSKPTTTQVFPGSQKVEEYSSKQQPYRVESSKPTLSISHSFKGMLENLGKFNGGKDLEKSSDDCKQAFNFSFTTSHRIFSKNIGFSLNKKKVHKADNGETDAIEDVGGHNETGKRRGLKEKPSNKIKQSAELLRKKMMKQGEETENGEGKMELCKKRILMGERCRPLNKSGMLHYDENGILLAEEILNYEEL